MNLSRHRPRPQPRTYKQAARAEQTEANIRSIIDAAISLIRSVPRLDQITLEDVARQSGLTVRTVLRRFNSRDGVLDAALLQLGQEIQRDRQPTAPGDIDAALESLLQQYERNGDLNIKALEQEDDLPLLGKLMKYGRSQHRAWLVEVFAPRLSRLHGAAREQRITELYAATDVYLWKLLRRDLGLSRKQTAEAFRHLVLGLIELENSTDLQRSKKGE